MAQRGSMPAPQVPQRGWAELRVTLKGSPSISDPGFMPASLPDIPSHSSRSLCYAGHWRPTVRDSACPKVLRSKHRVGGETKSQEREEIHLRSPSCSVVGIEIMTPK